MTCPRPWIPTTRPVTALLAMLVAAAPVQAALNVYTDAAAWSAALPQTPVSINFDDLPT